jgi:hypothetical protein
MATRSRIGIQLKNGSILSVYHHWDGYPQWLGRILRTHYNSRSLAEELIDGGDTRQNTVLSITLSVVKIALLALMPIFASIFFLLMVKSITISSEMVNGCAMI